MKKYLLLLFAFLAIGVKAQFAGGFYEKDPNAWFDKEPFFACQNNYVYYGYGQSILNVSVVINNKMINIGQRHLTISTCGLVPKIYEFADLETGVNLAVSLHAPNNEIRDKIMKINHAYKIEEVMKALDYYIEKTNRRVTIEYIMLAGINDSDKCAQELSHLVKGKLMYVNLIPYNETSNFTMKRSNDFKIKSFYDILKSNNVNVTIRKEMGGNLSAACGQLRANEMKCLEK